MNRSFTVALAVQTITFAPLVNKRLGDPPFSVSATASSGLPVTFSVVSGPATVDGEPGHHHGRGHGDGPCFASGRQHVRACPRRESLCSPSATRCRRLPSVPHQQADQRSAFTVSATASSGLPVTFSIVSGPATIDGNLITITGTGTVIVRASQAGDSTYAPAPPGESLVHGPPRRPDDHVRLPHRQADQRPAVHGQRHRVLRPARHLQHRLRARDHRGQRRHHHRHGHGDRPGLAGRRQHLRPRSQRQPVVHGQPRGPDDHVRLPHRQADQRPAASRSAPPRPPACPSPSASPPGPRPSRAASSRSRASGR